MLIARPQDTAGMKTSMSKLFDAMHVYEQAYGPYLWEKIGFYLVPFNSGAMEHATAVAYPQSLGAGSTQYDWLMAHELSHHWWGNLVTCKTSSDMWINEGFATYSEAIFLDVFPGGNAYMIDIKAKHYKVLQRAHFNDGGFYPLSGVPHEAVYGAHSYEKGAVMLHNMRTYLGDSLFFVGLKALQADFVHQAVDAFDMRDKLTEATGVNMDDFFDDWIMQPGFVGVVLDSFEVQPNDNQYDVTVHIKQKIRRADHLFSSFPLQISLVENTQNINNQTILFSGETMSATLTVPFVPQTVYLNGNEGIMNAVTAKDYYVNSNGTQIDNYSYSRVTSPAGNTPDNEWVRIEHCRVAPDPLIDPNLGIQISTERYWRIDGIWNENFQWNTWFIFDGRDNVSGNLDNDLLINPHGWPYIEDSMKLLYRPNSSASWIVLEEALLVSQGSPSDGLGRFVLDNVQKGEYTFGYKFSSLGINEAIAPSFILYPNPAQAEFRIFAPTYQNHELSLKITDIHGKVHREMNFQSGELISARDLAAGVYVLEMFLNNEKIGENKLVIESK
jgi:aminopeptidase N